MVRISNEEIVKLRLKDKLSLQNIADISGLSKQRVHQIIKKSVGNTGYLHGQHVRETRERVADKYHYLSNEELVPILGIKYVGKFRGGRRHAVKPNNNLHIGELVKGMVSEEMDRRGIKHRLMPNRDKVDIITDDGISIVVRGSHVCKVYPSLIGRLKGDRYSFTVSGIHERGADYVVLVAMKGSRNNMFIVPISEIPHTCTIAMVFPSNRPKIGRYQKYHNRWDFIDIN